jgi:hypothetical protein
VHEDDKGGDGVDDDDDDDGLLLPAAPVESCGGKAGPASEGSGGSVSRCALAPAVRGGSGSSGAPIGALASAPAAAASAEAGAAAEVGSAWQRREALLEVFPALQPDLCFAAASAILAAASVVVGLHPDQAAAEIVAFGAAYRVPFAVVPCCVYGYQFPTRKLPGGQPVRTYDDLVAWCVANGPPGTECAELPFEGKNKVVFWRGMAVTS